MTMQPHEEFLLEEYRQIRDEGLYLSKEKLRIQRQVVIGSAAIHAWISINQDNNYLDIISFIPASIAVIGFFKHISINTVMHQKVNYLKVIERDFLNKQTRNWGWQTYIDTKYMKIGRPLWFGGLSGIVTGAFWVLIILINIALGILYLNYDHSKDPGKITEIRDSIAFQQYIQANNTLIDTQEIIKRLIPKIQHLTIESPNSILLQSISNTKRSDSSNIA